MTARIILEKARSLPRFAGKVYLADLLDALRGLSKAELLRLHKAGVLRLSRCDLRQLADAERLDRGEIRDGDAAFHFLVVETF